MRDVRKQYTSTTYVRGAGGTGEVCLSCYLILMEISLMRTNAFVQVSEESDVENKNQRKKHINGINRPRRLGKTSARSFTPFDAM